MENFHHFPTDFWKAGPTNFFGNQPNGFYAVPQVTVGKGRRVRLVTSPPKTNMEPENGPLEKEIPIGNSSFAGSMLNFGGVDNWVGRNFLDFMMLDAILLSMVVFFV